MMFRQLRGNAPLPLLCFSYFSTFIFFFFFFLFFSLRFFLFFLTGRLDERLCEAAQLALVKMTKKAEAIEQVSTTLRLAFTADRYQTALCSFVLLFNNTSKNEIYFD